MKESNMTQRLDKPLLFYPCNINHGVEWSDVDHCMKMLLYVNVNHGVMSTIA
jgi:hypothetical protein